MRYAFTSTFFTIIVALNLVTGALFAQSGGFSLQDPILKKNGIEYALSGISSEGRKDPRWKSFPLLLEFGRNDGTLYSDIDVWIYDRSKTNLLGNQQKKIFEVKATAPWLLLRLAPGSYHIDARDRSGQMKAAVVEVPANGQLRKTLKW